MHYRQYIAFLFLSWALSAYAAVPIQPTEVQELTDSLAEITIVATDQRLNTLEHTLSTPVQTFNLSRIEQQQLLAPKSLSATVPNLYMPDYGTRMTSSIYMRGLGARIDNPVIGIYLNGIGLANKNTYDSDLFDIRQMQVLRSPQCTLYGKNTMGGIIAITTLSPLSYTGTRALIGYGNANTINANIAHYMKPLDAFGIALTAHYKHTDGFFRNQFDNSRADRQDDISARLIMEYAPSADRHLTNTLQYQYLSQEGFPYHFKDQAVNHNDYCGYHRHSLIEGLTWQQTMDKFTLSSTTSYQLLIDRMQMDQDFQPLSYFLMEQAQREHYVSEELTLKPLQALEKGTFRWNHISGLSASYRYNTMSAPVTFLQDGIDSLILKNANNGLRSAGFPETIRLTLTEQQFVISSLFRTHHTDFGIYHTSFLSFGDIFLEAGLRLNLEHLTFTYHSDGLIHYNITSTTHQNKEVHTEVRGHTHLTYLEALPRLAVSYKKPSWSVYASIAEGYKGGGFNTQLFSDILQNQMMRDMMDSTGVEFAENNDYRVSDVITYKPERCFTFEIGAKGEKRLPATDYRHSLSGSLALFELEVFNQQLTIFPEKGTGRFMTNAGHSRSFGAELTADYCYRDLLLSASYGYTNARFVTYHDGKQDYAGKYVPYAPQHTLSASATYTFRFDNPVCHSLSLNANTQAIGPIYWNETNAERQDFYALLNANITLEFKYLTLQLWGKNLTSTHYDVFHFVSMGNTFLQSGAPISYGAQIRLEI